MKSAAELHHRPSDDDRSAVTFWWGSLGRFCWNRQSGRNVLEPYKDSANGRIADDATASSSTPNGRRAPVDGYDKFTHFSRALCWESERLILMLTVYADDAGKPDEHEYVLVAGCIGLQVQWEQFCTDWRLRLAKAGLPEFHAAEFFNGAGIFAGWQTKERKGEREILIQDLARIIRDYVKQSFTCVVHVPGWNQLNEEFCLAECQFTPYVMCARIIVARARDWAKAMGYDATQVEYIFDQGNEDWGKLKNRLKIDLDIDAHDGDRRKIRPLQAADWFAYEEFREVPQLDKPTRDRDMRGSYLQLLPVPDDPLIYREIGIRTLCLTPAMLIPKRSKESSYRTRLQFDNRRLARVGRRWKRLTKGASALKEPTTPSIAMKLRPLMAEYEDVSARLDRAIGLKVPVTQGEDYVANMRIRCALMEQQVNLMEKIVALLKNDAAD